jgi:hypothetical protein
VSSESNTAMRKVIPILADRILLDLIERLEGVRAQLEGTDGTDLTHFPMLTDSALRAAISYLVELREARHVGVEW